MITDLNASTEVDFKEQVKISFMALQDDICRALEQEDGKAKFQQDIWKRKEGGGGRTRIMTEGIVIEKGGVNFSAVHGHLPQNILDALKLENAEFFATGVSIVIHPNNPKVPIIHMNVRYFQMKDTSWFGGGIDLTPHYIVEEDARFFHGGLKEVCDKHDSNYYPRFKKWADDYFFIDHRKETRGIGGIFFDKLKADDMHSMHDHLKFVLAVGNSFAPMYTSLMAKNKNKPFTPENRQWQKLRRGRYVEFNLVYDKGTKFGLQTEGRIESILMSLPNECSWLYDFQVEEGSLEMKTLKMLVKGIEWV